MTKKAIGRSARDRLTEMAKPKKAERILLALQDAPKSGVIVEVGCLRTASLWPSDGWSTLFLANAARKRDQVFISCDSDPDAVAIAGRVLDSHGELDAAVTVADGVETLRTLKEPVAFLYLDGSNDPKETLAQFQAATFKDGAIVAVDDVQYMGDGMEQGKATALMSKIRGRLAWDIYPTEPGFSMLVFRVKKGKATKESTTDDD